MTDHLGFEGVGGEQNDNGVTPLRDRAQKYVDQERARIARDAEGSAPSTSSVASEQVPVEGKPMTNTRRIAMEYANIVKRQIANGTYDPNSSGFRVDMERDPPFHSRGREFER